MQNKQLPTNIHVDSEDNLSQAIVRNVMATMAFKCFSRMESTVLVDSHELTAAMKSDQFLSYLLTQLDFCFAYKIFHVG